MISFQLHDISGKGRTMETVSRGPVEVGGFEPLTLPFQE